MIHTLTSWKNTGDYLSFNGQKIFFQKAGSSDTVILLLHGFPTASYDWVRMWPMLQKKYSVFTLDFLGFGFSDKPHPYKYSISEQADLVGSLLEKNGIHKIHILAHDYAVSVAQELLTRQQENNLDFKIKSICFLNGGMFSESYRPRLIQKLLLSPLGPLMVPFVSKGSLSRNFKAIFGKNTQPSDQDINDCWELIIHNNGKRVVPNVIQYLKDRRNNAIRWTKSVAEARIPLRLINGPEDPISGQLLIDKYKLIAKDPDVVRLDGIGHYPNMEAPELVAQHYFEFIERNNFK